MSATLEVIPRRTAPSSIRRHQDGPRSGSGAEAVVQASTAGGELVAAATASRMVAEPDVVRRGEAVRVWGAEARRPTVVHRARAATHTIDSFATVGDHGVLRGARGERVDRPADEGELGVGGRDPVQHLLVRDEVRRRLQVHDGSVSERAYSLNRRR